MAAEFTPDPGEGTGLDEAIAAYLAACEVEGKTRRTVQAYAETLGRFRTVCAAEGLPDRVAAFRAAHVYAFLKVISDSGVSLGTRHRLWCFNTPSRRLPPVLMMQPAEDRATDEALGPGAP